MSARDRWWGPLLVSLGVVIGALGCGGASDDDGGGGSGGALQYVMMTLRFPASSPELSTYGTNLDCDPDGAGHDCSTSAVDNRLGEIVLSLRSLGGFEPQAAMDAALAGGEVVLLIQIDDAAAGADTSRVWLGIDTDGDASDNFSGNETFDVSGVAEELPATLAGDQVAAGCRPDGDVPFDIPPITFPIELQLAEGRTPIALEVVGTYRATWSATGLASAVLAGGIPAQQVADVLVPELHAFVEELLTRPVCDATCLAQRSAHLDFWDTDDDGAVPLGEFAANPLFSPDLDILDDEGHYDPWLNDGTPDHLSFGLGFTATAAVFDAP